MEKDKLKTVDLFSGCGGMSLGFQNAGYEIVAAFDNWKPAVEVYKDNFDHPIFDVNLRNKESKELVKELNPNLIIGGPPCQDFSSAGKRDDTLGRAELTILYVEIISTVKPQYFVMENVERIRKSRILREAIKILKSAGYGISMEVLDASYCGVPQARKRFFMVGRLGETDDFLLPYFSKNLSKEQMTIHDYLGKSLGIEHYYRHPRSYKRRSVFSIHEPSPTIRGVNRPIPAGYPKHLGDTADVSENVRPLTTVERSYIQTFPKDFIFKGSKTNLEQIIGNAVPVKLGEFVAHALNEYIDDKKENKLRHHGQLRLAMEPPEMK
ncbi:MAG: DNA cytosine methyltransferase [Ekhidna sp.]|nr:DNA cytosine methyltransferase [Ekhidna sp.]